MGTIAFFGAPQVMGPGYNVMDQAMHGQFTWKFLLALALLKIVATTISFSSGTPGGMPAFKLPEGAWMLEYGRGMIPASLPFALSDAVISCLDGKTVTGFITGEAADELTLRDGEGREIKIPLAKIEDRVKQNISIMPEGLVKDLSVEEFSSLVSYVESLAAQAGK